MNIKTRVKKLETVMEIAGKDEFCQCYQKHFEACLNQAYGEPFTASDILPEGTPVTKVCERCQKPVAEHIREFFINVEEIYGKGSLI